MSKLISKISISIWKSDLTLRTKINYIYFERHPVLNSSQLLDRQPAHTKTDYQLLREALIKEFSDPESEQGLVAALETRTRSHESPQAYYSRLVVLNVGWTRGRVNAHLDGTGKRHGTSQSSFGNSRGKNSWESNGNSKGNRQTHPGATSPRNRRKNSQRFQADRAQTEPTQEHKTPPVCFDSQELMKMMMKEFSNGKREDRKWKRKRNQIQPD